MAERAIEPGCTVFSACEIRVALVPVGDVPQDAWEEYASLVAQHIKMELHVMRSFYQEQQKSPFTYLPWNTGSLHFTYLWGPDAEAQAAVTQRTVVSASHKILGVIGICHCPTQTTMIDAYASFEQKCRAYPDAFTLRCFAFEPSDSPEQQGNKSAAYLITFPTDDRAKLEYQLGVMMNDFAACLLMELEKWMLNASPAMINMGTWLDSAEFAVPVSTLEEVQKRLTSDEEVARKRRLGRLRKAMGDHCLLAGSPRNAEEHYSTAIDLARAVNDFIWLGAAIEGQIASKLLRTVCESVTSQTHDANHLDEAARFIPSNHLEKNGDIARGRQVSVLSTKLSSNLGEDNVVLEALRDANLGDEIQELFSEARAAYHKPKAVFLKLELDLKQARLLAKLYGDFKRKAVLDLLTGVVEMARLLDRPEDSLVATMEAAGICATVGAERKRALLLWRVTELCRTWDEPRPNLATRALTLVRQALLPNLTSPGEWAPRPRSASEGMIKETDGAKQATLIQSQSSLIGSLEIPAAVVTPRWPTIHCAILEALLGASTRTRSHQLAWRAAAAILSNFTNRLEERRQQWLLDTLQVASKFTDRNVLRGPGPPPLLDLVKIHRPKKWLMPIDVYPNDTPNPKKGPFIFTPFEIEISKVENGIRWVAGEECRVDVEVSNPCAMLLNVERMSLAGFYEEEILEAGDAIPYPKPRDYTNWRGVAKKVSMPPHTPPSPLDLTGIAKTPGRLYITGCYVQMFGVAWHQPWRNCATSSEKLSEPLISAAKGMCGRAPHRGMAIEVVPPLQLVHGSLKGERLVGTRGSGARKEVPQQNIGEGASVPAQPQFDSSQRVEDEAGAPGEPRALEAVVYEGEAFNWTLSVKNIGQQDVMGAVLSSQVTFLSASGATVEASRTLGRGGMRGVQQPAVEVLIRREAMLQRLPLAPNDAVDIPISIQIGESISSGHTECRATFKLEYVGSSTVTISNPALASSTDANQLPDPESLLPHTSSTTGKAEPERCKHLGRQLELSVNLSIRRMLKVVSCEVYCKDVFKAESGEDGQQTKSICCIELSVENLGSQPYCAWLSNCGGAGEGEGAQRAESGATVLLPGCCATVDATIQLSDCEDAACTQAQVRCMARHISATWGLHWRQLPMSPAAGIADSFAASEAAHGSGSLPRGLLPIHEAMVASGITEGVAQTLAPSSVSIEYRAKSPTMGSTPLSDAHLRDVAALLKVRGVVLPEGSKFRAHAALGCATSVGSVLQVSMSCGAKVGMVLQASLQCTRLFGLEVAPGSRGDVEMSPPLTDGSASGAMDCSGLGVLEDIVLHLLPNSGPHAHDFGLCFLRPGLYEVRVSSLRRYRATLPLSERSHERDDCGVIEEGLSVSERRLHVLVTSESEGSLC